MEETYTISKELRDKLEAVLSERMFIATDDGDEDNDYVVMDVLEALRKVEPNK